MGELGVRTTVALLLVTGFTVGACQAPSANISGAPNIAAFPGNYRQIIAQKIRENVKDPYSIRSAEISQPVPDGWNFHGSTVPFVCARFNAKNSFGGYTGVESWAFIFENGQMTETIVGAVAACEDRTYTPYPELETLN
jgi:hypothetical protein